mmetsp:Transcript_22207/g.43760  ORF Transcript_22207/g.43760 Transcript_22207/m.43760 type:complete len:225 (+) Transcript_22207:248-922(+)
MVMDDQEDTLFHPIPLSSASEQPLYGLLPPQFIAVTHPLEGGGFTSPPKRGACDARAAEDNDSRVKRSRSEQYMATTGEGGSGRGGDANELARQRVELLRAHKEIVTLRQERSELAAEVKRGQEDIGRERNEVARQRAELIRERSELREARTVLGAQQEAIRQLRVGLMQQLAASSSRVVVADPLALSAATAFGVVKEDGGEAGGGAAVRQSSPNAVTMEFQGW